MTNDPILDRVLAIAVSLSGPGRTPPDADPDTPLGDEGFWLDSLDLIDLIVACENEFATVLDAASGLREDALVSARTLARVIRSQIDAR